MTDLIQFFIVCPLVMLGGFVDAVAGGGGLISLPAYLIAGLPVHFAIGTNKVSSFMGTCISTSKYIKNGYVDLKKSIFFIIAALTGSATGAKIALLIEDRTFKIIMLIVLPLTAIYITKRKSLFDDKEAFSRLKTVIIGCLVAFFIGSYDGFYGPGTGTFLILLLSSVAHMPLNESNGTAKVINLSTNISALVVFLLNGKVVLVLGLISGLFSIAGNWLGTKSFEKGGAKIVKPLMLTVLSIFFIRILTELFL